MAACTRSGCGSTADVLDATTREGWIEVSTLGQRDARWYCTPGCAAAALAAGPVAGGTAPAGPMTEAGLLEVWDRGSERIVWERVRTRARAEGSAEHGAVAEARLAELPAPLVALAASADLVRRLTGSRWYVVMLAIEGGASWDDVAEALGTTPQEAAAAYAAAIAAQEKHVGDLHDAPRARAVLPGSDTDGAPAAGRCLTAGCGTHADRLDENDPELWGWVRVQVAGSEQPAVWVCSPACADKVMARAGAELAAADRVAGSVVVR